MNSLSLKLVTNDTIMYLYFTEELTPKRLLSVSKEVSCSLNFLCSTSLLQNMQRIQTNIVGFFITSSVVFMVLFQIPLSDPQNFLSSLFSTKPNWKLSPKPLVFHPYFISLVFIVIFFILGLCCFTFFPSVIICLSSLEDWTLLC